MIRQGWTEQQLFSHLQWEVSNQFSDNFALATMAASNDWPQLPGQGPGPGPGGTDSKETTETHHVPKSYSGIAQLLCW